MRSREMSHMPKRIPIKAAREFSKRYGLTHFILLAYDGELNHVVTYGDTAEHCSQAADFGNTLKEKMGWPASLLDQPPRVKRLQEEVNRLNAILLRSINICRKAVKEPPSGEGMLLDESIAAVVARNAELRAAILSTIDVLEKKAGRGGSTWLTRSALSRICEARRILRAALDAEKGQS